MSSVRVEQGFATEKPCEVSRTFYSRWSFSIRLCIIKTSVL